MKTLRAAAAGLLAFGASLPAAAADLPARLPAYPAAVPYYSWTGFYIGGDIGGAWTIGSVSDSATGAIWGTNRSNWIGGAVLGGNLQLGQFVVGVEGNFDWTSLKGMGAPVSSLLGSANTTWISTAAGRFGVAMDRMLIYGKAGGAWAQNAASVTSLATGAVANASNISSGWLLGGGLEYAVAPNWTTKVEYNYVGLQSWSFSAPFVAGDRFNASRDIQSVKFGLNYKF